MKIKREVLVSNLVKVSSVANYKDARGIIKLNLIETKEEGKVQLNFFGSDGINTVLTNIQLEANDVNFGEYYINSKKIIGFLKNLSYLKDDDVELSLADSLKVNTGKGEFDFPLVTPKAYPQMPNTDIGSIEGNKYSISIDSISFVNVLNSVGKTAIKNSTRPILEYVNAEVTADNIDFISTDSVRASRMTIPCEAMDIMTKEKVQEQFEVNINANILSKLVTPVPNTKITMIVTDEMMYVVDSTCAITMKPMNEKYIPEFRTKILPYVDFSSTEVPYSTVFEISGEELRNSIRLLKSVIYDENEKLIKFDLSPDKKALMTENSKDTGSIELQGELSGEGIAIVFDPSKLDVLNSNIEKLRMCFRGKNQPVYFYDANDANAAFLVVPVIS